MPVPTLDNVDNPRGLGYGFALDNRLFRMVAGPGRELTLRTAPSEAPRVNTASSAEELAAEYGITFSRSQFDGGEGLYRAHVAGAEPNRFWDSKNVSVTPAAPGEFPEVKLLYTTEVIESLTETTPRMAYDDVAGSLYVTSGTILRRSDNPTAATPTFVNDDPHDGETATDVEGVVTLGEEVYAALGANGIHQKSGGTWSHWSDLEATRIWTAKRRIIASDGRSLYEVTASGAAPSAILTLAPGEVWNDVVDGGSHVLAAASNGYVYAFTTDSGSLVLSTQTKFEGEQPTAVGQSQGAVAVGTTSGDFGRLYVGRLDTNGLLGDLTLVREWDTGAPRVVIGTRSSLLTAVPDASDTFLWRYDLRTAGVSRHLTLDNVVKDVYGLLVLGNKRFASVAGEGIYRETSVYSSEGYLIGPLGDFLSSTNKSWVGATLDTGALGDGRTVEMYHSTNPDALSDPDSTMWVRDMRRDTGTGGPQTVNLTSVVSRSIAGMVKLYPQTDLTATPAVRSFAFAAYASSGDEDSIITIPANVSDQVERRGVSRRRIRGLGASTYRDLMTFEGRPVLLTLFAPDLIIRGLVEEVGTPVPTLTKRGTTTLVSMVRVRGKQVGQAGTTSGTGTFGTASAFGTPPPFGVQV